jgi:hypothetical protein
MRSLSFAVLFDFSTERVHGSGKFLRHIVFDQEILATVGTGTSDLAHDGSKDQISAAVRANDALLGVRQFDFTARRSGYLTPTQH